MLNDENRTSVFSPDGFGFGRNIVGSGAEILQSPPPAVPEPATIGLVAGALFALALLARRRSTYPARV